MLVEEHLLNSRSNLDWTKLQATAVAQQRLDPDCLEAVELLLAELPFTLLDDQQLIVEEGQELKQQQGGHQLDVQPDLELDWRSHWEPILADERDLQRVELSQVGWLKQEQHFVPAGVLKFKLPASSFCCSTALDSLWTFSYFQAACLLDSRVQQCLTNFSPPKKWCTVSALATYSTTLPSFTAIVYQAPLKLMS